MTDHKYHKYYQWIQAYHDRTPKIKNKCLEATLEMKEEYPELIRKRGFIIGAFSNRKREHWWLETNTGTKIDPTAKQFGHIIEYIVHDEDGPEPIGKCIHCGEYIYPNGISTVACSKECQKKILELFNQVSYR